MNIERHWLVTAALVALALGAGFGAARMIEREPHGAHAEEEPHHEEEARFVALSPQAMKRLGIELVTARRGGGGELALPGRVKVIAGAEAVVDAPLSGVVTAVRVGIGDRVTRGSVLAMLRSPEGAASRAEVDAAVAGLESAQAAEHRDRTLFEQGWAPKARLDVTAAATRKAEAELRAARARAAAYGQPGSDGQVAVRSPIAGVVTKVAVTPGKVVHEEALEVAAVSDASRVELVFESSPAAAAGLTPGAAVTASVPGGAEVRAVITAVAPANEAGVVVVRAKPSGPLPPAGTVVSARLSSGEGGRLLTVPLDAVQTVEGAPSVFVLQGEGFQAVPVATGRTAGGRIEIVSGLDEGAKIAGANAFLLKAELGKGEAGHGH